MGPVESSQKNHSEIGKQKPLTRQQIRHKERIESEAQEAFNTITGNFLNFFTGHENPESTEIKERQKQISAQWRLFCHRKNLVPKAFPAVDEYCNQLIENYRKIKNGEPGNIPESI